MIELYISSLSNVLYSHMNTYQLSIVLEMNSYLISVENVLFSLQNCISKHVQKIWLPNSVYIYIYIGNVNR